MRSAGRGLTLVEVLVALALFALVSLALSTSLLQLVKVDTRSRDAVKTSLTLQQTAEAIKAAWGNPLPAPVVQSGQSYAVTNYARNCVDALTLPPGVTATSQVLTLSLDPVALTDAVAPAGVPQPLLACTPAMDVPRLCPMLGRAGKYMSMAKGPMADKRPSTSARRRKFEVI